MGINKGTLGKEIDGVVQYIYPKTTADIVEYDKSQSVERKIQDMDRTTAEIDKRVTNIASGVQEGSVQTKNDAELFDIRIPSNNIVPEGTTYASAGEAVRGQLDILGEKVSKSVNVSDTKQATEKSGWLEKDNVTISPNTKSSQIYNNDGTKFEDSVVYEDYTDEEITAEVEDQRDLIITEGNTQIGRVQAEGTTQVGVVQAEAQKIADKTTQIDKNKNDILLLKFQDYENMIGIGDSFFKFMPIIVDSITNGYKLLPSGFSKADSNYKLIKFVVNEKDICSVDAMYLWQFQAKDGTPQSGNHNRIGSTFSGKGIQYAPVGAKFLVVSCLKDESPNVKVGVQTGSNLLNTNIQHVKNSGVSVDRNKDGSFTINGTATQNIRFFLTGKKWDVCDIKKARYRLVGCPKNNGTNNLFFLQVALGVFDGSTIIIKSSSQDKGNGIAFNNPVDCNRIMVVLSIQSGQSFNNVVIKPMLTTYMGATYDSYIPCNFSAKTTLGSITEINESTKKKNESERKKDLCWDIQTKPPYWILHIDAGNKFFSVETIKLFIDTISKVGFNQINFYFSAYRGFRFALNNMNFVDEDGDNYDLTPCLGGLEASTSWYTQSDMDEIIMYARSKQVDIVPNFDMPGHMEWILNQFPQFKYKGYGTLDFTNPKAVKFMFAILKEYCKYFSSRGCKFWNIGFDELEPKSFETFYNEGKYDIISDLANKIIDFVTYYGFIPRIWNEVVLYKNDYNCYIDKRAEVYVWDYSNPNLATPNQILNAGYDVINMSSWFYWVLDNQKHISPQTLCKAKLLENYNGYSKSFEHPVKGAVLSIWCADVETNHPNDGGIYIFEEMTPLIEAFGEAITLAGFEQYQDN